LSGKNLKLIKKSRNWNSSRLTMRLERKERKKRKNNTLQNEKLNKMPIWIARTRGMKQNLSIKLLEIKENKMKLIG